MYWIQRVLELDTLKVKLLEDIDYFIASMLFL